MEQKRPDSTEKLRKKLIFRSWHRGTREMDLIMGRFADAHVNDFDEAELRQYEELLQLSDPDIYNWLTGREDVPANLAGGVIEKLKAQNHYN